jgi:hypothetical protein
MVKSLIIFLIIISFIFVNSFILVDALPTDFDWRDKDGFVDARVGGNC